MGMGCARFECRQRSASKSSSRSTGLPGSTGKRTQDFKPMRPAKLEGFRDLICRCRACILPSAVACLPHLHRLRQFSRLHTSQSIHLPPSNLPFNGLKSSSQSDLRRFAPSATPLVLAGKDSHRLCHCRTTMRMGLDGNFCCADARPDKVASDTPITHVNTILSKVCISPLGIEFQTTFFTNPQSIPRPANSQSRDFSPGPTKISPPMR